MNTLQAPEILSFDQIEKDENSRAKTPVVRLGTLTIEVTKAGRRETDGFDMLLISLSDLKRIAKEGFKLGWAHKCRHIELLRRQELEEIGG